MSETAAVIDLDLERLVHIDQEIDANEDRAIVARWEFGHQLLAVREGAKLPSGYRAALVERTGKSATELTYRMQFAEAYPTREALFNALNNGPSSWREITKSLKAEKDAEDNTVSEPPAIPDGKFATFVADPPWRYGNTSTRGAAENHYPTMSIEELCELDVVPTHAADQAHLYMWTTAGHLPEAFKVMEAWGFEYKTYLVWTKPQMGMGNYFRVSTELVLFGIRGGLRTQTRNTMNYFDAPRQKHSAKPPQFQDLVVANSPGPYMELFSRCNADSMLTGCQCSKCRLGWTVWGNQS